MAVVAGASRLFEVSAVWSRSAWSPVFRSTPLEVMSTSDHLMIINCERMMRTASRSIEIDFDNYFQPTIRIFSSKSV